MGTDNPTTLCTWPQFAEGAFNDLARSYTSPAAQAELLAESTRLCEQLTGRRLVPFTGLVESHRATGVDPDEYPAGGIAALSTQAALGQSYAHALGGVDSGVRHCWLDEHAPRYPEMWTYTGVSVSITTTFGGEAAASIIGPEVDSGHMWFRLGTYVPPGSLVRVTYGGGYQTIPADLVRAGKLMTAALVMREIQPNKMSRDPVALWDDAERALAGYLRD